MSDLPPPRAAIVDYGTGNLYNVRRACQHVGLEAAITTSPEEVLSADAVILPGVGSMPEAMLSLELNGLSDALRTVAGRGTPLLGICLGMQLLMEEGSEFTRHAGLGILSGSVVRFPDRGTDGAELKVPHIGWNAVGRPPGSATAWRDTPLEATPDGEYMYFVHSYHVVPANTESVVGVSRYGGIEFCSVVSAGAVFGCQFHPERSGSQGLRIYREFSRLLAGRQHSPLR
ncbi:MAG: imidazole glycerol phosphate synthase subunit HisH [Gemmatimonadales bacterium]|nr:imidazole glycerol phosphate synthase subunit HisH [Gemmatimonadales bacterium]MDQ3428199.1 imidazole glycerol phosphate synthase subunit HisH [Gemmatimonadota bacterium]